MRVLFAHDHIFSRDLSRDEFYTEGKLPYAVWQRYLEVFDEMVVTGRCRELTPAAPREHLTVSSGPNVRLVPIPSLSNPIAQVTRRSEALQKMTAAVQQVDAVIARMPSEIGALAIEVAKKLGKPWAVEVVGCAWDALWNYGNWQGKVYAPVSKMRTKRLIAGAPFAIYVTKQFLQERYPAAGQQVGCSDVEINAPEPDVLEQRLQKIAERFSRGNQRPLKIGIIASLSSKYKGVDVALNALRQVVNDLPTFEFHILGGGDPTHWQQVAQSLGMSRMTVFCGALPSAEVPEWLDSLDFYLQPSLTEGLPRAVVESMSRGLPILASRVGGIPELLDAECLVRPGDADELAQKIARGLGDAQWLNAQAIRNFEQAQAYTKPVLDSIREQFWRDFAASVSPKVLIGGGV